MNARFDPAFLVRPDYGIAVERACYRRSRRSDPVAIIAALVAGLAAAMLFAAMNPVFVKLEKRAPTVVRLLDLPTAPPPPPAQPEQAQMDSAPTAQPQTSTTAPAPELALPGAAPVMAPPPVPAPAPAPVAARPAAPPAPSGPENAGDISARMVAASPPRYPVESRRAREQGTVVLAVLLSVDGRVSDISVARSSGFARLDRAALEAVRNWRWSPMLREGAPVMVRGLVTIPFVLQGGDSRRAERRDRDRPTDGQPDTAQPA